ncbi:MAG: hypothetical protein JSV04_06060 [Candidatus Heimdallarchaeota archaeon]|nr:MAG: hypothetical protein JSV04_06060 [Candidatus Heimdallarchaeota archaeon]
MSYSFESEETHDVKIEDVKPLEKRLNTVFKVIEREEEREINSRSGETHRVCDLTVADETGSIILTLWNEDIDNIEDEKVYKLSNGFANVFRNSIRLSKGKFGTITEDSTVFDQLNQENNRSSEHVEDPRRRSYSSDRSSGGYGSRGSSYDNRRRDSGRRRSW